jgi:chitodextrinase
VGIGGTNAGVILAAIGPDLTPPGTVNNLAAQLVSDQMAILTWTAPGDDGSSGTASAYDLRWSTSPISLANFDLATPAAPQPTPGSSGASQSYVMNGLTPGTTYYFALKARDEAGNWSSMSNVLNATTAATDQTPPAPVTDLSTTP